MPLRPKQYPPNAVDPVSTISPENFHKFFGVHPGNSGNEVGISSGVFYGEYKRREQP
jgi:hypothetical protein